MNYGLYLSASGVLTNMHRQDVIANNMANISTAGFKRQLVQFSQRDAEVIEDRLGPDAAHKLLDRLGGTVFVEPTRISQDSGALNATGNELDIALQGEGFLIVQTGDGTDGSTALTRDGRLVVAQDGRLITATGEHAVLNIDNQPIYVDRRQRLEIDQNGLVRQSGAAVGRIQVAQVDAAARVRHRGQGLYTADEEAMANRRPGQAIIRQGFMESSNVEPTRQLVELIETARAINNNSNMIRYHDLLMDRAVNQLGRVA